MKKFFAIAIAVLFVFIGGAACGSSGSSDSTDSVSNKSSNSDADYQQLIREKDAQHDACLLTLKRQDVITGFIQEGFTAASEALHGAANYDSATIKTATDKITALTAKVNAAAPAYQAARMKCEANSP